MGRPLHVLIAKPAISQVAPAAFLFRSFSLRNTLNSVLRFNLKYYSHPERNFICSLGLTPSTLPTVYLLKDILSSCCIYRNTASLATTATPIPFATAIPTYPSIRVHSICTHRKPSTSCYTSTPSLLLPTSNPPRSQHFKAFGTHTTWRPFHNL